MVKLDSKILESVLVKRDQLGSWRKSAICHVRDVRGESWFYSPNIKEVRMGHCLLPCVALSFQTQGPTLREPTSCVGWECWFHCSAQPSSSLFPPRLLYSTALALILSPHDSSVVRLQPLSSPVNPVHSSRRGGQHYWDASPQGVRLL